MDNQYNKNITLQDVYTVVNRVEDKLDTQLAEQDERLRGVEKSVAEQGIRNRIQSFVTSAVVSLIIAIVGRK